MSPAALRHIDRPVHPNVVSSLDGPSSPEIASHLDGLVRSNAITEHQRDLLISNTVPLEDLWANPYLRSVRDHSRAYIEHLMFGGFGAAPRPNSDRGI